MSAMTTPLWQPDDEVQACPLCHTSFSWWTRKHHCRKCGRVICNACANNYYSLPSSQIVRPEGSVAPSDTSQVEEARICDGCFSRIEQDRCRRMLGLDISVLDPRIAAQLIRDSITTPNVIASPPPSYSHTDIPRRRRRASSTLLSQPHHGRRRRAVEVGSSVPRVSQSLPVVDVIPLRYVAFELTEHDKVVGEECSICFEEYESGQTVARLECWCIFHVDCIQAWKDKKASGGCPLHFHD